MNKHTKQSLKILKRLQKWRMGDDKIQMPLVADITYAINHAIYVLQSSLEKEKK